MKRFKRRKTDLCNICLQIKPLSWDHIPPKGGIELSSMEINDIYRFLAHTTPKPKISQNGVKYRYICSDCNTMLGRNYDVVLNSFSKDIGRILRTNLSIPDIIKVRTKPNALIKAILGHLVSVKSETDEALFDRKVRDYLFSDTVILPDDINIFYWVYPYDCVVIMRDFVMCANRDGNFSKNGVFQLLKYFPVAYLITNLKEYRGLPELTRYRTLKLKDEVEIPILIRRIEEIDWPERVDRDNIIFASRETGNAIFAKPKRSH
jgi:hypothetical protein